MEVKKNNHDRKLENGFEYKDTIQFLYETIPKKRDDQSSILSLIQDSLEITYLYTNEFDFKKYYSDKTEKIVKLLKHYATNIFMSKDNIEILIKNNFSDFLLEPIDTDANIISFVL